jgi:hypothetical protein
MTLGGWINMFLSVGFVTSLFGWCIYRILKSPKDRPPVHAQTTIDPRDQAD